MSSLLFDMSVSAHAHGQVCCYDTGHEVELISMVFWSLRKRHPQVSNLLPLEIQARISAYLLKPDSQAHLSKDSVLDLRDLFVPVKSMTQTLETYYFIEFKTFNTSKENVKWPIRTYPGHNF